jgi:DeoR/GlpR family transcriptional regulator of sugar metabolism
VDEAAMKEEGKTKISERRRIITKLVNQQGYASIEQLAEVHEVSAQTIRRDILALSKDNLVTRHHGGAGTASSVLNTSYKVRQISKLNEKRELARTTAAMIRSSQSMFISGGSTMEIVAQEISRLSTICVITNNIHAAFHLYSKKEIDLLMPCGRVRHHNGGIVGAAAIDFIGNFHADYMLMGIGAISPDGLLLDYDYDEAMIMKGMMENAREVILVTDGSKFEQNAIAQVGNLSDVSCLVTDRQPPANIRQLMAEYNVSLVIPDKLN